MKLFINNIPSSILKITTTTATTTELKSTNEDSSNDTVIGNNINIYYVLGIIDALLFLWALFQLIRIIIYSRNGAKNLKPKLIFHFIIAVTMMVRSGFFFASQEIGNRFDTVVIWYEVSGVLLFAGYGCLLLFWMELYSRFSKPYTTSKDFWKRWRPRIIIFSGVIICSLIGWIITLIVWGNTMSKQILLDQIVAGIVSGLFLVAGFGFLIYGILLFVSFKKLDKISSSNDTGNISSTSSSSSIGSNISNNNSIKNNNNGLGNGKQIVNSHSQHQHLNSSRTSIMNRKRLLQSPPEAIRAAVVGSICTVCFCIRSIITLYSIRESISDPIASGTTQFNLGWEFELSYFFITEILPTVLMMFRLRKMKKKKTTETNSNIRYSQYSPIISTNFVNNNSNHNNINTPLIFKQQNDYDDESSSSCSTDNHHTDNDESDSSDSYAVPPSYKTTILPA